MPTHATTLLHALQAKCPRETGTPGPERRASTQPSLPGNWLPACPFASLFTRSVLAMYQAHWMDCRIERHSFQTGQTRAADVGHP